MIPFVPRPAVAQVMTPLPRTSSRALLALFAVALLLGATLSFWVQPLVAKLLLPVLGGSWPATLSPISRTGFWICAGRPW